MSEEKHTIEVFLNAPQFLKYRKGKSFQLSNAQLQSDSGKHKVDIHLAKKDYRKLLLSIKNKKGFRFTEKNIKGGSLWGSFKSGLSKAASFVKNNVNKEDVKNVIKKGVDMVAPDSVKDLAKSAVDKVVDYGYDDSNKGKSLKEHALSLANDLQPELKDAGMQVGKKIVDKVKDKIQTMDGEGLRKFKKGSQEAKDHMARIRAMKKTKSVGSSVKSETRVGRGVRDNVPVKTRPVKGSQEAKDHMAKIRAMRKTKGAGFWDNIASGLIHTGLPKLGYVAGQMLGGVPGAMVGETLGNLAGDAIGEATGRGLTNTIHTPYGAHVNGIPNPVVSKGSAVSVRKHGYHKKQRNPNGLHINGGSFLQLGA
jgi:hypothetical protein